MEDNRGIPFVKNVTCLVERTIIDEAIHKLGKCAVAKFRQMHGPHPSHATWQRPFGTRSHSGDKNYSKN